MPESFSTIELDKPTLTNHMPDIVAEIIRDLALSREGAISEEHTRGSPPVHGVQRFSRRLGRRRGGRRCNLLRIAFITLAERNGLYVAGAAAHIINHRIDEAVRMAVMAFAAQQALIRKSRRTNIWPSSPTICARPSTPRASSWRKYSGNRRVRSTVTPELIPDLQRNLQQVEDLIKRVLATPRPPPPSPAPPSVPSAARSISGLSSSV